MHIKTPRPYACSICTVWVMAAFVGGVLLTSCAVLPNEEPSFLNLFGTNYFPDRQCPGASYTSVAEY